MRHNSTWNSLQVDAAQHRFGGPGRIRTYVGISRQIYSLLPLAAWVPTHGLSLYSLRYCVPMPSFDVVSEIDRQELKNAVDQAQRELANRYDFKNTNSSIELADLNLTLKTSSEDRLKALKLLLEERLVKRNVSLKCLDWGKVEGASGDTVRQLVSIKVGINSDKAREVNRLIKDKGPKGVSSQTQSDQVRVTGKKRDDLQSVIALLKSNDLGIPLQFINFRD